MKIILNLNIQNNYESEHAHNLPFEHVDIYESKHANNFKIQNE